MTTQMDIIIITIKATTRIIIREKRALTISRRNKNSLAAKQTTSIKPKMIRKMLEIGKFVG